MMKKTFVIFILLLTLSSQVYAGSTWTEEVTYGERVRGKLLFGVANIFGGWIPIFHEPEQRAKDGKGVGSVLAGIPIGFGKGALTFIGGWAHLLTFPITFLDIPLPDNGVDL